MVNFTGMWIEVTIRAAGLPGGMKTAGDRTGSGPPIIIYSTGRRAVAVRQGTRSAPPANQLGCRRTALSLSRRWGLHGLGIHTKFPRIGLANGRGERGRPEAREVRWKPR